MKKVIVKLGFVGLSIPQKIQKARNIVKAMTGNASFPNTTPDLGIVTNAIDVLEVSHEAALDGGKDLTATMNEDEEKLDVVMTALAGYVQSVCDGNEQMIRSAGMEVRKEKSPQGPLPAPEGLKVITSDFQGELDLKWTNVVGAKTYILETSTDNMNWSLCGHSTRADFNIKNLVSLTYQWFRVAAIGTAGQGPWSEPAKGLVV